MTVEYHVMYYKTPEVEIAEEKVESSADPTPNVDPPTVLDGTKKRGLLRRFYPRRSNSSGTGS